MLQSLADGCRRPYIHAHVADHLASTLCMHDAGILRDAPWLHRLLLLRADVQRDEAVLHVLWQLDATAIEFCTERRLADRAAEPLGCSALDLAHCCHHIGAEVHHVPCLAGTKRATWHSQFRPGHDRQRVMTLHEDAGILLLRPRLVAASTTCRWLLMKGAELLAPELRQPRMLRLISSALEAQRRRSHGEKDRKEHAHALVTGPDPTAEHAKFCAWTEA